MIQPDKRAARLAEWQSRTKPAPIPDAPIVFSPRERALKPERAGDNPEETIKALGLDPESILRRQIAADRARADVVNEAYDLIMSRLPQSDRATLASVERQLSAIKDPLDTGLAPVREGALEGMPQEFGAGVDDEAPAVPVEVPVEDIPPELAVLMEADETLDAARNRFYLDYQNLRSLFVGQLEMGEEQKKRWARYGKKVIRAWLRITD